VDLENIKTPEGVKSIGKWAFSGCSSLKNITISEGLESVGEYAFSDCSALEGIAVPNGVKSIGNNAFYRCSSLASATIPEGVITIKDSTFENCTSLASIIVPKSVKKIGDSAFSGCKLLKTVAFLGDTKYYNYKSIFKGRKYLQAIAAPSVKDFDYEIYYRGFFEMPELFDEDKKAAYIKGMLSNRGMVSDLISDYLDNYTAVEHFVKIVKPGGKILDRMLKLTTSQGKTELTAILLEYGNSNGNKKSPIDDLKWD
jgi:hypothetical protein